MTPASGSAAIGDLRPFLRHLCDLTGPIAQEWFHRPGLEVQRKADRSVVTEVDRRIEDLLRAEIAREFPAHGIIGEERADTAVDAEFTWVLDPIDGTQSYVSGCPLFGTLIALRQGTQPLWGAIHLPALGQLFLGDNETAWCGERAIRVREPAPFSEAVLLCTDPYSVSHYQPQADWKRLCEAVGVVRGWGDCYGYTLVAGGFADIMVDPILNLWDLAALLPVVRGAGAHASDWQGGEPETAESLIVCHPGLRAQVMASLGGAAS